MDSKFNSAGRVLPAHKPDPKPGSSDARMRGMSAHYGAGWVAYTVPEYGSVEGEQQRQVFGPSQGDQWPGVRDDDPVHSDPPVNPPSQGGAKLVRQLLCRIIHGS